MNYILQMNGFWRWRKTNALTNKQADMYFAILDCANSTGWKEVFNIPNSMLIGMCDLSISELYKQRLLLIQKGLIEYSKGKKGTAGRYSISILYDSHLDSNSPIAIVGDSHSDSHLDSHLDSNSEHIPKLNKTKLNTSCHNPKGLVTKKQKRVYPTDSEEMKLSLLLSSLMLENKPNGLMPKDFQQWCNTFRLMMEPDKRKYSDIVNVIKFSQWDSFWKDNIRSADKLRIQFDQLEMKMESERKKYDYEPQPSC